MDKFEIIIKKHENLWRIEVYSAETGRQLFISDMGSFGEVISELIIRRFVYLGAEHNQFRDAAKMGELDNETPQPL